MKIIMEFDSFPPEYSEDEKQCAILPMIHDRVIERANKITVVDGLGNEKVLKDRSVL